MQSIHDLMAQAIAVRLARARLTKSWLADAIGMSQPALSARLHGKTPFNVNELSAIAEALEMSGHDLLLLAVQESEWSGQVVPA